MAVLGSLRRGAPVETAEVVLVLLHGGGVPANDLASFADGVLAALPEGGTRVGALLPEGPLVQGLGRGWFVVPEDGGNERWSPPDFLLERLALTVKAAIHQAPRPPLLVVGGFSMGSIVAGEGLATLRREGIDVAGLVILSGSLTERALLAAVDCNAEDKGCNLEIFMSHGRYDDVVPEQVAHDAISAASMAADAGVRPIAIASHFHSGGHEVGDGTVEALADWIRGMVERSPISSNEALPVSTRRRSAFSSALAQQQQRDQGIAETATQQGCGEDGELAAAATPVQTGQDRLSDEELEVLLSMQIEPIFDHPKLLDFIWGEQGAPLPAVGERAQFGGVPCVVLGRKATSEKSAIVTPIVVIFGGRSDSSPEAPAIEDIAQAYVDDLGAIAIIPRCARKLSECLASARSVIAALPKAFGPWPVLVHGIDSGSILAIQVAAEQASVGSLPRVWLLVLDSAPPGLSWIPGAQSMLGCLTTDPLMQLAKLKLLRCHAVILSGSVTTSFMLSKHVKSEPVDMFAAACGGGTTVLRSAASPLQDDTANGAPRALRNDLTRAAKMVLQEAETSWANSVWKVTASSLLMREAAGLASPEAGRLQSGALVHIKEQQATRLRVQKVEGQGPDAGWISFVVSGQITLAPAISKEQ